MKKILLRFADRFSPLQQLLLIGLSARLFSVVFSKGFGWHDDHFLIIESSQSWADGFYNYWLPTSEVPDREPQGHALLYTGLHYYLFVFFNSIGLKDPQFKMLLVRLLHALWSLLIIRYGYKIAKQYGNDKTAWYTGLFLSLYWFMPFLSVRNLSEFVSVPPVLTAIYLAGKPERKGADLFKAGFWLGLAFSIRFQTIFLSAGIWLALLILRYPLKTILLSFLSFTGLVLLTQGVVDLIIWKRPFAEFMAYFEYNLNNAGTYGTDVWHMYFDLILGLLIPPLSLILFAGYFFTWKRIALCFWPVLLFLGFHTWFPNKQERFVLTILPLIIISGNAGAAMIIEKYHLRPKGFYRISKIFVITVNLLLIPFMSTAYSKRHRVESMYYLYRKGDKSGFMIEDSNKEEDFLLPPLFYYGKWMYIYGITRKNTADSALVYFQSLPADSRPGYLVFYQAENLRSRVDSARRRFPGLRIEKVIEPSLIDKTLYWLNPLNDNQTTYIYKIAP